MTARLQTLTLRDAKGNTATVKFRVTGATPAALETSAAAVITAIQGITTLATQAANGPFSIDPQEAVYPTFAEYGSVEDKAAFTFQTAKGAVHRFRIPGPPIAIFLADGQTVDPANTNVVAYTSAVVANCVDTDGNLISFGGFGIRQRVRNRKRLNIFVKAADLSTPAE